MAHSATHPEDHLLTVSENPRSNLLDRGFTVLVQGVALLVIAILLGITAVVLAYAQPAIAHFGLAFLWSTAWDVPSLQFGALPYIFGTLVTSSVGLILALPISMAVAILTSENFLPAFVREPLAFLVQLLAAIPSVVIGLWGIYVLIPFLLPIGTWLNNNFGWFPLFSTPPAGPGLLPAGVILAVMIIPTIASVSRDVLTVVPKELRSASMALGATQWETILAVMLPAAAPGVVGASMLGLGRALGETMAVSMVIGNSGQITASLLDLGNTIPSLLASQFAEAESPLHIGSLMYLALILFVLTLMVNVAAVLLVRVFGVKV